MNSGVGLPFTLRGVLVVLRDFQAGDEEDFVSWASFDQMYTYRHWRLAGPAEARQFFLGLLQHPSRLAVPRRHWYLAVLNAEECFVGISGIDLSADGIVEFGWYVSPPAWGKGYATAATELILAFAFTTLEAREVYATCDPENAASRRVMEKNDMSLAGEEESRDTWRGPRPRLRLALTVEDWRTAVSDDRQV